MSLGLFHFCHSVFALNTFDLNLSSLKLIFGLSLLIRTILGGAQFLKQLTILEKKIMNNFRVVLPAEGFPVSICKTP